MSPARGIELLWAVRSPCNLNCQYCYFGTLDETISRIADRKVGELTHVGRDDLDAENVLAFAATRRKDIVHRVFFAGGEPLIWGRSRELLHVLTEAGTSVVLCTNGQGLVDSALCAELIEMQLDAVSISLDSADATYNDHWRVDRSGRGWSAVRDGMRNLLRVRDERHSKTRIGVYMVVSRLNMDHIVPSARFVDQLGADYFIVQPISLPEGHRLDKTLTLRPGDTHALQRALDGMASAQLRAHMANEEYLRRMVGSVRVRLGGLVRGCFGGRDLFFVQPDGTVWDCPSFYKIQDTREEETVTIRGRAAAEVFGLARRGRNTDCRWFSRDCVNMWQLMAFDELIVEGRDDGR